MGLVLGLSAALLWGLADYSAAMVSRQAGALRVVLGFHAVAVLIVGVVVLATGSLDGTSWGDVLPFIGIGAVGACCYLSFYRALAIAPVSIVSPVVSGNSAVIVILSLLLLGEVLSVLEAAAIVVVIAGAVIASTNIAASRGGERMSTKGMVLSLLAMLSMGGFVFSVSYHAEDLGWLVPIFLGRTFAMLFVLPVALRQEEGTGVSLLSPSLLWKIAGVALLDTGAFVAFNFGIEHADTAIVAGAAAPYAVIPIVLGVLILKERPGPVQRLGIATVVGGVAMLALVAN